MGYGSVAYQLEQEEKRQRIEKTKKREKAAIRKAQKVKNIKIMFCTVLIALAAFLMVSRYVEVYETEKQIAKLQKQLAEAEALTCQKMFELEQSVDLKTVEDIATTKLGMQRPEKYQIVYINVKKEDSTEVTADSVEGIKNRIESTTNEIAKNIVGIFSIK
ncbi:MAG: cell division protein FtsL [Clostridia bacterium]|nr:cell division protein FtsL [Clostridia bacterium]